MLDSCARLVIPPSRGACRDMLGDVEAAMDMHSASAHVAQNGVATLCCLVKERRDGSGGSGSDRDSPDDLDHVSALWKRFFRVVLTRST